MIEALTVSVNYADYLRETLPTWLPFVDRVLVLTNRQDEATCRVVEEHCGKVAWLHSNSLAMSGPFDRGIAINQGLAALDRTGWVLLIDADIGLVRPIPPFRDKRVLYGAMRLDVIGRDQWRAALAGERLGLPSRDDRRDAAFTPKERSRLVRGYFQLFYHKNARRHVGPLYPEGHPNVSGADWAFARQFGRLRCRFPRELFVACHLSMPGDREGANWDGRTTPAW